MLASICIRKGELMNQITAVAAELAKDLIVVCAADACGRTLFFKQFGFRGFASGAANLPPCTMAMEACSSASSRVNAAQRMRTPCATYTLARMTTHTRPIRPFREMQSDSRRQSPKHQAAGPRAPPRTNPLTNLVTHLTGNSLEIVRRQHVQEPVL
jgi:hypothetical protein